MIANFVRSSIAAIIVITLIGCSTQKHSSIDTVAAQKTDPIAKEICKKPTSSDFELEENLVLKRAVNSTPGEAIKLARAPFYSRAKRDLSHLQSSSRIAVCLLDGNNGSQFLLAMNKSKTIITLLDAAK